MTGHATYKLNPTSYASDFEPSINNEVQGIRVMIAAMLERAVKDAGLLRPIEPDWRHPRTMARLWLKITEPFYEDEIENPSEFSFVWCAYALNCDPIILQRKLVAAIPRMQNAHGRVSRMVLIYDQK